MLKHILFYDRWVSEWVKSFASTQYIQLNPIHTNRLPIQCYSFNWFLISCSIIVRCSDVYCNKEHLWKMQDLNCLVLKVTVCVVQVGSRLPCWTGLCRCWRVWQPYPQAPERQEQTPGSACCWTFYLLPSGCIETETHQQFSENVGLQLMKF